MTITTKSRESGEALGVIIALVLLSLTVIALGGLAAWSYVNYAEQKNNVQAKVDQAVATAEKVQSEKDDAKFADREKEPNREFAGPSDYGRLSFSYPKTWSVYVDHDGSKGGDYEAYLNPVSVPSVSNDQRYALRITISEKKYEDIVKGFSSLVQKGSLKTSATSSNGQNGTRLDGSFTEDIRGAAVIYKIRDKTAILQTDADTFKPDFNKLVKTINFNQ